MTPADELRAAATTLRDWTTDETTDRWAPSAIAAFGPDMAAWLDEEAARLDATATPFWQEAVGRHPLAVARRIIAA